MTATVNDRGSVQGLDPVLQALELFPAVTAAAPTTSSNARVVRLPAGLSVQPSAGLSVQPSAGLSVQPIQCPRWEPVPHVVVSLLYRYS